MTRAISAPSVRPAREASAEPLPSAYRPGDEAEILALFEHAFGKRRDLEGWRWQFERAPEGRAIIHLLVDDRGRLIGHLAHLPFATWIDGARRTVAVGCDLMVRRDWRRRGAMRRLVERFLADPEGNDALINFPGRASRKLLLRYGLGRRLGRLPKWVRWLGPDPALGAAGALVGRLGALHGRLLTRRLRHGDVETIRPSGDELDELARDSAAFAPCVRRRDAAYLTWRWSRPGDRWTMTAARAGGRLSGFAVLGVDGDPARRRGRIVDLLARDPAALRALLLDAADRLAAAGCRRLVCELQDPRPWARRELARAGFVRLPGDLSVLARALSDGAGAAPSRLANWYLTRGDTDLA